MLSLAAVGSNAYLWIKWLHVVAVIAWMAGMLYLPRLYVYHAKAAPGSELSETLKIMERRLLRLIVNPSMIVVFITGLMMFPEWASDGWAHLKVALAALMALCHGFYARWRKDFEADRNTRSHTFYRWANEAPTVLLLLIVAMVVFKPFS